MRKVAGFRLSADEVVNVATQVYGSPVPSYQEMVTSVSIFKSMCEKRDVGYIRLITADKGSKEPLPYEEHRYWFHMVIAEELRRDEDEFEYDDIPFDINDPYIKRAVDVMKEYGFLEEDLKNRWMTITGFNVRDHDMYQTLY